MNGTYVLLYHTQVTDPHLSHLWVQQEELIQMIRGRQSAMDRQRIAEQIVRLNKVTPTGLKNYC